MLMVDDTNTYRKITGCAKPKSKVYEALIKLMSYLDNGFLTQLVVHVNKIVQ